MESIQDQAQGEMQVSGSKKPEENLGIQRQFGRWAMESPVDLVEEYSDDKSKFIDRLIH